MTPIICHQPRHDPGRRWKPFDSMIHKQRLSAILLDPTFPDLLANQAQAAEGKPSQHHSRPIFRSKSPTNDTCQQKQNH